MAGGISGSVPTSALELQGKTVKAIGIIISHSHLFYYTVEKDFAYITIQ